MGVDHFTENVDFKLSTDVKKRLCQKKKQLLLSVCATNADSSMNTDIIVSVKNYAVTRNFQNIQEAYIKPPLFKVHTPPSWYSLFLRCEQCTTCIQELLILTYNNLTYASTSKGFKKTLRVIFSLIWYQSLREKFRVLEYP